MANAWLSVLGLYNYDNTIFDALQLPVGVDRNMAISKIILDNGELGLVYSDPDTFKLMMRVWTKTHEEPFQRMYDALTAVYNPIHNYDRTEEWTDAEKTSYSDTNKGTNLRQVAGWNETESADADAEKISSDNANSGSGNRDATRKGRLYGNIGVTTTQEMINAEIDLRVQLNFYQLVSDAFRAEFCLMVY